MQAPVTMFEVTETTDRDALVESVTAAVMALAERAAALDIPLADPPPSPSN